MSAALLLAYAAALSVLTPAWLGRAAWTSGAPRLAIFTWLSLAVSVILALVSAGGLLIVPTVGFHTGLEDFAAATAIELPAHHGNAGATVLAAASVALSVVLPAALLVAGISQRLRWQRRRRTHLRGLRATARKHQGVLLIEHDTAAAYCLPGRNGTIVVTTGAVGAVDEAGLKAVVQHEQAHVDGRHHLLLALADTGRGVLGFLPLFAQLPERLARLVELRADDVAAAQSGRRVLARSLLAFAESRLSPPLSLPVAGFDTVTRMERLVAEPGRLNRGGAVGIAATGTAAMALPVAVTVATLATVTYMACCT